MYVLDLIKFKSFWRLVAHVAVAREFILFSSEDESINIFSIFGALGASYIQEKSENIFIKNTECTCMVRN